MGANLLRSVKENTSRKQKLDFLTEKLHPVGLCYRIRSSLSWHNHTGQHIVCTQLNNGGKEAVKRSNYNRSIAKWKNAVKAYKTALKEDDSVYLDLIEPCGFCIEFEHCFCCPLYSALFCSTAKGEGKTVFWRIVEADKENDYKLALELSEQMLTKIESFKSLVVDDKMEDKP
jgi:hypothetical protein